MEEEYLRLPTHNPQHYLYVRPTSVDDVLVIREIWCENVYEVESKDISTSKIVVDLGAHIGTFSVFVSQFDPDIQVHAYEPEPHNLKLLEKNIEENDLTERVFIHNEAVWSESTDELFISNKSGGSSVMADEPHDTKVKAIPLNDILDKFTTIDLLKIDVEGAENEIVCSTDSENLAKCRYITMELDGRNYKWGEIVEHLSETHHVRTMGKMSQGGMLFAKRYE